MVQYLSIEIVQLVSNHEEFRYKIVDRIHRNISNLQHHKLNHQEMYIDPKESTIERRSNGADEMPYFFRYTFLPCRFVFRTIIVMKNSMSVKFSIFEFSNISSAGWESEFRIAF